VRITGVEALPIAVDEGYPFAIIVVLVRTDAPRAIDGYVEPPRGPGLGVEFKEAAARRRASRDVELPRRYWPDGAVADY
jgi:L-alanine-DL-glutamate epimerase-like enolase superfamily enzyme